MLIKEGFPSVLKYSHMSEYDKFSLSFSKYLDSCFAQAFRQRGTPNILLIVKTQIGDVS